MKLKSLVLSIVITCTLVICTIVGIFVTMEHANAETEDINTCYQPIANCTDPRVAIHTAQVRKTKTPTLRVRDNVIDQTDSFMQQPMEEAPLTLEVQDSLVTFAVEDEFFETITITNELLTAYSGESDTTADEVVQEFFESVLDDSTEETFVQEASNTDDIVVIEDEFVSESALEGFSENTEALFDDLSENLDNNIYVEDILFQSTDDEFDSLADVFVDDNTEMLDVEPTNDEAFNEEINIGVDECSSKASNMIVDTAASKVGVTPYVNWYDRMEDGIITNSFETGTDCSGFVSLVYAEVGIDAPTGSDAYQNLANTTYEDLQPGDVVVYRNGAHVAIYAGDDTIIHCSNEIDGTKVSDMFYDEPTGYVHFEIEE